MTPSPPLLPWGIRIERFERTVGPDGSRPVTLDAPARVYVKAYDLRRAALSVVVLLAGVFATLTVVLNVFADRPLPDALVDATGFSLIYAVTYGTILLVVPHRLDVVPPAVAYRGPRVALRRVISFTDVLRFETAPGRFWNGPDVVAILEGNQGITLLPNLMPEQATALVRLLEDVMDRYRSPQPESPTTTRADAGWAEHARPS